MRVRFPLWTRSAAGTVAMKKRLISSMCVTKKEKFHAEVNVSSARQNSIKHSTPRQETSAIAMNERTIRLNTSSLTRGVRIGNTDGCSR